jgi:hypothetical protein
MGDLYDVVFEAYEERAHEDYAAIILWAPLENEIVRFASGANGDRKCFIVADGAHGKERVSTGNVRFAMEDCLDRAFKGASVTDKTIAEFSSIILQDNDRLLCSVDSKPYWISRPAGESELLVVALGPDELTEEETIYSRFNRNCWLRLFPVLHFLKNLPGVARWTNPPLRACLMFDDPNLHWSSYGWVNFGELIASARRNTYHVSFATIPVDTWYSNASVVQVTRKSKDALSLCIHGNDHIRNELAIDRDEPAWRRLLAQAIRRISEFEKRTQLRVDRVMVPPYGAFSATGAPLMTQYGFEALCVSRASLTAWNKEERWNPDFGHQISESVGGLPVIPRHVMAEGHECSYRLAAFLSQPIIPHGHHQDCADGLGLVEAVASAVNGIGDVQWMSMEAISRSNYLSLRCKETLRIRMMARKIVIEIPEGVTEIVVERPWLGPEGGEDLEIAENGTPSMLYQLAPNRFRIALRSCVSVELSSLSFAVDMETAPTPGWNVFGTVRRIASEIRDRIQPMSRAFRR